MSTSLPHCSSNNSSSNQNQNQNSTLTSTSTSSSTSSPSSSTNTINTNTTIMSNNNTITNTTTNTSNASNTSNTSNASNSNGTCTSNSTSSSTNSNNSNNSNNLINSNHNLNHNLNLNLNHNHSNHNNHNHNNNNNNNNNNAHVHTHNSSSDFNSLKAKIEQTRAAREAFLRGTIITPTQTPIASTSSATSSASISSGTTTTNASTSSSSNSSATNGSNCSPSLNIAAHNLTNSIGSSASSAITGLANNLGNSSLTNSHPSHPAHNPLNSLPSSSTSSAGSSSVSSNSTHISSLSTINSSLTSMASTSSSSTSTSTTNTQRDHTQHQNRIMESSQYHSNKQQSVTSIVRDNYLTTNSNREIVTDKASLMASLNNTNTNTNTNTSSNSNVTALNNSTSSNSHYYQNVPSSLTNGLSKQHNGNTNTNGITLATSHPPVPQHPPSVSSLIKANQNLINTNHHSHHNHHTSTTTGSVGASSVNGTHVLTASSNQAKQRVLDGYVGFANLPNQVYRKSVKKGFEFNLMVIGESGLGKSTFINSLFLTELYNPNDFPGTFERRRKTTFVDSSTCVLTEKGVNLRLTVIDTPGFGDSIDNSNCWTPIVDYIDNKYEEFLNAESKVNRKLPIIDQRVHCCLYFISPGHTLKQLDIEVMKKLHDRVNLIPVIAKADTMTLDEIKQFKQTVLNVIADNKLQIYEFPDIDDDDIENNRTNSILKSKLPFAIVGSNTVIEIEGKQCRGRQYPWGVVNIDELGHCDFMALRTMLIRTHMQDLKDVTNNVHYENYRFKKLAYVTGDKAKPNNKNPFQQLEEERRDAELRLEKMKNEMEGVFEQKVKEKIARLRESELNLEKQQEAMRLSLEKEERDLEEKRAVFLKEKQLWEESNKEDEDKLKHSLEKEVNDKKKKKIF